MLHDSDESLRTVALMPSLLDPSALAAEVPDTSLALLAARGDRQAFAQLVERHYDYIYRIACKWTGKASDAEDVAQRIIHAFHAPLNFGER